MKFKKLIPGFVAYFVKKLPGVEPPDRNMVEKYFFF